MPFAIDQAMLDDPSTKVLDIGNPPMIQIPYQAFPKALYLHPKDKQREHRIRTVETQAELDAATKQGWRTTPHVPEAPPDAALAEFETDFEVKKKA